VLEGYSPFKASHLDDPVLRDVANSHGVTTAQVVLRWHIDHGVVVIPKSVTPERIEANFDVFGFALSEEELARVDALGRR
jgi:diketogulonate reductase-like aldo/keto reductase